MALRKNIGGFRRWVVCLGAFLAVFIFGQAKDPLLGQDSLEGKWTWTGSLHAARICFSATLLPDGRVLVVGGYGGSDELASAEVYQPDEGVFVQVASLHSGRSNHTATLLKNGQVLLVGGQGRGSALASAELYDAGTNTWSETGSLHFPRSYHTATLLNDGRVLVAGGASSASPPVYLQGISPGSAIDSAEIYDPASGKWTVTGSLNAGRFGHAATLLADGEVLVTGGMGTKATNRPSPTQEDDRMPDFRSRSHVRETGGAESSAELYDPTTKNWIGVGSLASGLFNHTSTLLGNNQVLVVGGLSLAFANEFLENAELFQPERRSWIETGPLHLGVNGHSATLLPNGHLLVVGGANGSGVTAKVESYNPSTLTWSVCAGLNKARGLHTATLLRDGRVLIAGGGYDVGSPSFVEASAEIFEQDAVKKPELPQSLAGPSAPVIIAGTQSPLITFAAGLVIVASCLVIITACVVVSLAVWLVFVLVRRWQK